MEVSQHEKERNDHAFSRRFCFLPSFVLTLRRFFVRNDIYTQFHHHHHHPMSTKIHRPSSSLGFYFTRPIHTHASHLLLPHRNQSTHNSIAINTPHAAPAVGTPMQRGTSAARPRRGPGAANAPPRTTRPTRPRTRRPRSQPQPHPPPPPPPPSRPPFAAGPAAGRGQIAL